jgi:hypothetical protein
VVQSLVHTHVNEILLLGKTLASNGSINMAAVTSCVRETAMQQKQMLQQMHEILDNMADIQRLQLPPNAVLQVGVRLADNNQSLFTLETLHKKAYEFSRELSVVSLGKALMTLHKELCTPEGIDRSATRSQLPVTLPSSQVVKEFPRACRRSSLSE